jgi:putative transposase
MKQKRYTDEQIAFALRQAESGTAVAEICRKLGVSEPTFYRWKKQFAGMGTVEIRRLKQLEEENAKLKRLSLTSASTRPCCRTCCEKNGEARAAP